MSLDSARPAVSPPSLHNQPSSPNHAQPLKTNANSPLSASLFSYPTRPAASLISSPALPHHFPLTPSLQLPPHNAPVAGIKHYFESKTN